MKLVRSVDGKTHRIVSSKAWGKALIPCKDPDGIKLSKFELEGIQLIPDFPVIPKELWSRYIALCFYMCPTHGKKLSRKHHGSQLEVQVCLLRDAATFTKWKIVVPKQKVSVASVESDLTKNVDIVTGEEYTQFPPVGWVHAGSSHSHNTMDSFFSATDNRSELTVPGLHIVIGNINHKKMTYTYEASVVLQKNRKTVDDLESVVDSSPTELGFHPKVLNYINQVVEYNYKFSFPGQSKFPSYSSSWSQKKSTKSTADESWSSFTEKDSSASTTVALEMGDGFLYGLDRNNSDLFDDYDEFTRAEDVIPADDDIREAVHDGIKEGFTVKEILESLEAKADDDGISDDEVDLWIRLKETEDSEESWNSNEI